MLKLSSLFLLVIFIASCGGDSSPQRENGYSDVPVSTQDSLFKEVMEGHDVGMARMGKLSGYQKQLTQQLDSIKKANPEFSRKVEGVYVDIRNRLKEAEEGMNRWMDEFKIDSAEDRPEDRIRYLQEEKIRVEKVKTDILSALGRADSLLGKKTEEQK